MDHFVVSVYDRDAMLYIPASAIRLERRKTTFRLDSPRDGQEDLVRHPSDYEHFEFALREISDEPP